MKAIKSVMVRRCAYPLMPDEEVYGYVLKIDHENLVRVEVHIPGLHATVEGARAAALSYLNELTRSLGAVKKDLK